MGTASPCRNGGVILWLVTGAGGVLGCQTGIRCIVDSPGFRSSLTFRHPWSILSLLHHVNRSPFISEAMWFPRFLDARFSLLQRFVVYVARYSEVVQ